MVKTIKTVYIDADIYALFQQYYPSQASSFFEEQMRLAIGRVEGNFKKLDLEIAERQLKAKLYEMDKKSQEVNKLKDAIKNTKKMITEEETERLEKEKALIEAEEKKKKCMKCLNLIDKPIQVRGVNYQLCLDCLTLLHGSPELKQYIVDDPDEVSV